ncbi:GAF domain-containing protein [Sphingomonas sp. SAFR-052]|uniref:GAF domain-containing protein n=1 Tax=Sphingomonas sp. SAFR-052 TaxID=3436867 RepID=UPI003F7EB1C1
MPFMNTLPGEELRLEALRALEILDSSPEAAFDVVAAAAQHLFGCKLAFVSLIDADRQWFKARCGIDVDETDRGTSFCTHAVAADELLVIPDTFEDERFSQNPFVLGPPFIRFYAGVPLRVGIRGTDARLPVGTLCVADDRPQSPSSEKLALLNGMAQVVESLLETRRLSGESLRLALERQDALDDGAHSATAAARRTHGADWFLAP